MAEAKKIIRLSKAAGEFNVGITTIVEFLFKKGIQIETKPNTKISPDIYDILLKEFYSEKTVKEESDKIGIEHRNRETISIEDTIEEADYTEDTYKNEEELFIKNVASNYSELIIKSEEKTKEIITEKIEEKIEEIAQENTEKDEEIIIEQVIEKTEDSKEKLEEKEVKIIEEKLSEIIDDKDDDSVKVLGKIDLDSINTRTRPKKKTKAEKAKEAENRKKGKKEIKKKEEKDFVKYPEPKKEKPLSPPEIITTTEKKAEKPINKKDDVIKAKAAKLIGPKILDKIDLSEIEKKSKKPVASSKDKKIKEKKKKRRRIVKESPKAEVKFKDKKGRFSGEKNKFKKGRKVPKAEPTAEEIQKQIKETLARLSKTGKSKGSKYRRQKRDVVSQNIEKELQKQEKEKSTIQVTEFVTANELATMINVEVNQVITRIS